jgi:hypothetical protein
MRMAAEGFLHRYRNLQDVIFGRTPPGEFSLYRIDSRVKLRKFDNSRSKKKSDAQVQRIMIHEESEEGKSP